MPGPSRGSVPGSGSSIRYQQESMIPVTSRSPADDVAVGVNASSLGLRELRREEGVQVDHTVGAPRPQQGVLKAVWVGAIAYLLTGGDADGERASKPAGVEVHHTVGAPRPQQGVFVRGCAGTAHLLTVGDAKSCRGSKPAGVEVDHTVRASRPQQRVLLVACDARAHLLTAGDASGPRVSKPAGRQVDHTVGAPRPQQGAFVRGGCASIAHLLAVGDG